MLLRLSDGSDLAALSCKELFLILHTNKIVLRPRPSFLPKVVLVFHFSENIVLLSLCPAPTHSKEISFHCLDIVKAISPPQSFDFYHTDGFLISRVVSTLQRDTLLPSPP